jgi:hypothetical protein
MNDLNLINTRLQELNKEFRELSALKKEIQDKSRVEVIKQKYGDFKYMIKSPEVIEKIDFDKLLKFANAQVGKNEFGLPVIAYDFGNGLSYFSIVKEAEDVYVRVAVDQLLKVADSIREEFKVNQDKLNEASEIFNKFDEAFDVNTRGITTVSSDTEDLS